MTRKDAIRLSTKESTWGFRGPKSDSAAVTQESVQSNPYLLNTQLFAKLWAGHSRVRQTHTHLYHKELMTECEKQVCIEQFHL